MRITAASLVVFGSLLASGAASATTAVFSENFNDYTNNTSYGTVYNSSYGNQVGSNNPLYGLGSLASTGWQWGGNNSVEAFDKGAGDYAVMLNGTDYLTKNLGASSNAVGTTYTVTLQYATTAANLMASATSQGDQIEIRIADNGGTAQDVFFTPDTTNPSFVTGTFSYVGRGLGNAFLQILGALNPANNTYDNSDPSNPVLTNGYRYAAAIDNVAVTSDPLNVAVPEPASLALLGAGLLGMGVARRRRS